MTTPKIDRYESVESGSGAISMVYSMSEVVEAVEQVRRTKLTCRDCYLAEASAWGGQSITEWDCIKCGGRHVAGSTAHDSVCKGCALEHGICQWCGEKPHMYQK